MKQHTLQHNPHYNLSYLYEMKDQKYFCEILRLFLTTAPAVLEKISVAMHDKDWDQVYQSSHKLKSSLGILQMHELLKMVSSVELKAKEKADLENIPSEVKAIVEIFLVIKPLIEEEFDEGKRRMLAHQTNQNLSL